MTSGDLNSGAQLAKQVLYQLSLNFLFCTMETIQGFHRNGVTGGREDPNADIGNQPLLQPQESMNFIQDAKCKIISVGV